MEQDNTAKSIISAEKIFERLPEVLLVLIALLTGTAVVDGLHKEWYLFSESFATLGTIAGPLSFLEILASCMPPIRSSHNK